MINKKAQLQEIAYVLVFIFSFVIMVIVGKVILDKIETGLDDSGLQNTQSKAVFTDFAVAYPAFDSMIIWIVVLMTIGLVITSFLIPSHPVFIIVNIIGIFVIVFLAAILSNVYAEIAGSSVLISAVAGAGGEFSKMHFVMTKLPWIAAVIVVLATIAMVAKGEEGIE